MPNTDNKPVDLEQIRRKVIDIIDDKRSRYAVSVAATEYVYQLLTTGQQALLDRVLAEGPKDMYAGGRYNDGFNQASIQWRAAIEKLKEEIDGRPQ